MNYYRKWPISGTGRRSSDHALNDPNGSEVVRASVGSGDDVSCTATWNDDDEDSDCSESRSSGDVAASPQRAESNVEPDTRSSRTSQAENVVAVNSGEHDVDDDDDVEIWTPSTTPVSKSTRRDDWSTSAVARRLPAPTSGRVVAAVRTQAPPYRVDHRPTTTAWRRGAFGHASTPPSGAVRRRPGTANGSSSLGLNIGLIVGIAAGVVILFLVLGYAVNRYRRCRGVAGADCGSYRLDRAAVGGDPCCRCDGMKLIPSQPAPPLGLQSTPRGCYGTPVMAPVKACKLPSKEWYV